MTRQEPELPDLLNRIEKLERQNHRLKQCGLVLLVVASSVLTMGQAKTTRVQEAEKFVLLDGGGKERAKLDLYFGEARLSLYDEQGKVRVMLTSADLGGITIFDAKGNLRTNLNVDGLHHSP